MKSHYAVLGVSQQATQEEIKTAWRKLARATHPDKVKGKEAEFDAAARAYDILWHPMSRAIYDQELLMLAKCTRCGGVGTIRKQKGFTTTITLPCPECNK